MREKIQVRYLMCDRFTRRTILEFDDQKTAVNALHALSPIRQEKYELIPQVVRGR